ncbi:MAG: Na+/H+ antiporter NhaA, partial [Alistipes sp.]|nr:Na+/H+ antiporter NhaA [Alistipes sp.]
FVLKMQRLNQILDAFDCSKEDFPNEEHRECLRYMSHLASRSVGMSYRLENALAPYVTFLIMPIFALANAGVHISSSEYLNIFHFSHEIGSVGMGVFFGLLIGKPLGIFTASYCAVKARVAEMPQGATWRMLLAVACLGGIGFTMSLFVDSLAFTDSDLIDRGKIAILMGSTAAAILGSLFIVVLSRKNAQ